MKRLVLTLAIAAVGAVILAPLIRRARKRSPITA